MSLDPIAQGQLEQEYEDILENIAFCIEKEINDPILEYLHDTIDGAIYETGYENFDRSDFISESVDILMETNDLLAPIHEEKLELKRENKMLRHNVKELQGQLQESYKKIKDFEKWLKDGGAG